MRADKQLRKDVDDLFRNRPGWKLQGMPTPGVPPVWCFGTHGTPDLTVGTDGGSVDVYVIGLDQDVRLGSTDELLDWLRAHKPESLQEPRGGVLEDLKRGRFMDWE